MRFQTHRWFAVGFKDEISIKFQHSVPPNTSNPIKP